MCNACCSRATGKSGESFKDIRTCTISRSYIQYVKVRSSHRSAGYGQRHHLLSIPAHEQPRGTNETYTALTMACTGYTYMTDFWLSKDRASWCILIMKANEMHYFSNLYDTLHVADKSTVHHQEYLNTVYTQLVFVMLVLLASARVTTKNSASRWLSL
jgi:hypothetical protein